MHPWGELLVAFFGIGVVASVSPLAYSSLNEGFGCAIGARCVGPSKTVADAQFLTGSAKAMRAITMSVVGEQTVNGDAVPGIESNGGRPETRWR